MKKQFRVELFIVYDYGYKKKDVPFSTLKVFDFEEIAIKYATKVKKDLQDTAKVEK